MHKGGIHNIGHNTTNFWWVCCLDGQQEPMEGSPWLDVPFANFVAPCPMSLGRQGVCVVIEPPTRLDPQVEI
jgi:hypothetical protein